MLFKREFGLITKRQVFLFSSVVVANILIIIIVRYGCIDYHERVNYLTSNINATCRKPTKQQILRLDNKSGSESTFSPIWDDLGEIITKNCNDGFLVPNVVHYVWLGKRRMRFYHYISILSAYRYIKPCYIVIHGDHMPFGPWWDRLIANISRVLFMRHEAPVMMYGHKLVWIEHAADIIRLEVLIEYGGMYFDTDVVVVRSFDNLRDGPLTLDRDTSARGVANAAIVTMKNNPFLKIWLLAYNAYDRSWGGNSVRMARKLVDLFPSLSYVGDGIMFMPGTSQQTDVDEIMWKPLAYSIHLFARYFYNQDMEMKDILRSKSTFAMLCRHTLFGDTEVRR